MACVNQVEVSYDWRWPFNKNTKAKCIKEDCSKSSLHPEASLNQALTPEDPNQHEVWRNYQVVEAENPKSIISLEEYDQYNDEEELNASSAGEAASYLHVTCSEGNQSRTGTRSLYDMISSPTQHLHCDTSYQHSTSPAELSQFHSEDQRNRAYDSWFRACENWERKRLKWLCEVARMKGYEDSTIIENTFLEHGPSETIMHLQSKHLTAEDTNPACTPDKSGQVWTTEEENQRSINESADVWDEWYRIERLHRHKSLYNDGLHNWYEELLSEEENRYKQGSSFYASLEEAEAGHYRISNQVSPEVYYGEEHLSDLDEKITSDDMSVYQFTDRNFWLYDCCRFKS